MQKQPQGRFWTCYQGKYSQLAHGLDPTAQGCKVLVPLPFMTKTRAVIPCIQSPAFAMAGHRQCPLYSREALLSLPTTVKPTSLLLLCSCSQEASLDWHCPGRVYSTTRGNVFSHMQKLDQKKKKKKGWKNPMKTKGKSRERERRLRGRERGQEMEYR